VVDALDPLCGSLDKCEVGFLAGYTAKIAALFEPSLKGSWAACEIKLMLKAYIIKDSMLPRLTAILDNFVDL
jgi:hypothetical protein